jgi:hypothetical protein
LATVNTQADMLRGILVLADAVPPRMVFRAGGPELEASGGGRWLRRAAFTPLRLDGMRRVENAPGSGAWAGLKRSRDWRDCAPTQAVWRVHPASVAANDPPGI